MNNQDRRKVIEAKGVSKVYKKGQNSLSIKKITRKFFSRSKVKDSNEYWALKNVDFDIYEGECFGILGRNGAGKSTLLKILAQITFPSSGSIKVSQELKCLLSSGTGFHNDLTGRENIILGGVVLGMKKKDIVENLDEIIAFSELEEFIDTPLKFYSNGMRARLGFSTSMSLNADIIILDEVLAAGDYAFREKSLAKMSEKVKSGKTIIYVTHSLSSAETICNRGMILDKGEVAGIGEMGEMASLYKNLFFRKKVSPESTVWKNTDSSIELLEVHLVQDRPGLNRVASKDPIEIKILIDVKDVESESDIIFRILETNKNPLFISTFRENQKSFTHNGRSILSATIPGNTFFKGKYILEVGIKKSDAFGPQKEGLIVQEFFITNFDLFERGAPKKKSGRVNIPVLWKIENQT